MKLKRESDWGPIGTNPTDPPTSKKYFSVPPEKGEEFSSALVLINQSEGSVTCTFCEQGHPSASCGVVTDIEARRNLLKREGRCFMFTSQPFGNHLSRICSGRHYMTICDTANSSRVILENAAQGSVVMTINEANRWETRSIIGRLWFKSRCSNWKRFLSVFLRWRHETGVIRSCGGEDESWMGAIGPTHQVQILVFIWSNAKPCG